MLDVALDGNVLWDTHNFFEDRRKKILTIVRQAGLKRDHYKNEFAWQWQVLPRGSWELTWQGFRELP